MGSQAEGWDSWRARTAARGGAAGVARSSCPSAGWISSVAWALRLAPGAGVPDGCCCLGGCWELPAAVARRLLREGPASPPCVWASPSWSSSGALRLPSCAGVVSASRGVVEAWTPAEQGGDNCCGG
jgi:hypothetical protein